MQDEQDDEVKSKHFWTINVRSEVVVLLIT